MRKDSSTDLHAESIIIDGLNICRWSEAVFKQMTQGGLTAINATIAIHEGFRDTISNIAHWHRLFDQYGSMITPVKSVDDIRRAKREKKVGVIFGFQSTDPIERDLYLLSVFKELGVRIIQLTYNERNYIGDGCLERTDCGLSLFGLEVIEEMNRLGILIDLSHTGYRTAMETIEASKQPVVFTHANPRTLCDHPRNKTDEQIRAVVDKGGLIGANVFPAFLAAGSKATIEDVVDVIDYLVRIAGIDHVGIGTDFTEGQTEDWFQWLFLGKSKYHKIMTTELPVVNPKGIRTAAEFPNITKTLLGRGYSPADTKKIMGENFIRLFGQVWGSEGQE